MKLKNSDGDIVYEGGEIRYDESLRGWVTDVGVFSDPDRLLTPVGGASKVSPIEFKLLFTAQERVAIKASADAIVRDFFGIVEDPRLTHVDLGLKSTQDALTYLEALSLIAEGRKDEILTGVQL